MSSISTCIHPGATKRARCVRRLMSAALALALAASEVAWPATSDEDRSISTTPSLSVIAKAPDFALLDTAGKPVKLSDYRGRTVLLAFIFTTCPGVCPLISKQMQYVQTKLKSAGLFGKEAVMLSVTVDPQTDTAPVLAAYAKQYGADPAGWRFLRESDEKTKPILKAYDEWTRRPPKGELDHPARVYLIDRQANIREIYSLTFFNEKQALIDIQALLKEPAR
jgi:protein SCO1